MDTTIDQKVAMDEALVPHAHRLRIGRSNFCILSDISSKESTLQLVYDVLRILGGSHCLSSFYLVQDGQQEAYRNLESFREMMHIYPRLPGQSFVEPPFEEEILAFLWFIGYSGAIRRLTDAMIAYGYLKLKFFGGYTIRGMLTSLILYGKTSSIRLSIKVQKRAMGCIILGSQRDDHMFTMIKLVSRHQNMQQFGALLPIELTNADIMNSDAYKEYYAFATGATPPKPKASVRKTRSSFDTTVTPPTAAAGPRLSTSTKGKQTATTSKAKSLSALSEEDISWNSTDEEGDDNDDDERDDGDDGEEGNDDDDDDDQQDEDDQEEGSDDEQAYDEEEFIHPSLSTHAEEKTRDEESFDPIPKIPKNTDDEGNGKENLGMNVGKEVGQDEEDEEDILYRDVNNNLGRENDEFLKTIDENMQKIIKEQVKEQVKVFVEAYESNKIILDTYGDTVTLKRRRDDDADKDEEPSAGSDRGSKRRREGKEPESASALKEKATKSAGQSTQGSKYRQTSASEYATTEEPMQTTFEMKEPSHPEFETGADDQPIVEPSQHPEWFSQQKKPPTLDRDWNKTLSATHESIQSWIRELANLVELKFFLEEVYKEMTNQLDWFNHEGQQYPHNLLKPLPLIANSRGRRVIPFDHFINNDLEYLHGGALSRKYTTYVTKTKAADYGHIKWIADLVPRTMWIQEPVGYDKHALWEISHWGRKRQQFYGFAVNQESARDVYSKCRIIAVTELKIVEWHNYKHLDWIMVRRDDDKLYKFKEGDFKRLRIQDIEDMCMEDLQLGVESYQKKLNLTKLDTYRSDLKHKEAYIAYSNPRGFIYHNKDKRNRLMRIDELHKFSDETLTDVRTALDDRLKWIRMKYLPQSIWRKSDKDKATAMIQAIDKMLKTRRIMRSLERFVEGRMYEGDFKMLQRTI
nr:hypothetical protein [Tanacetum cinerariifolium]